MTHPQKDGLSFRFELCSEGSSEPRDVPPEIAWEDSRTVRISTVAEANCGASWIFGDYSVSNDTVTLQYQAVSGFAMCDCGHKVSYRIEGLPKKAYRVELQPLPEIAPVTHWIQSPWTAIGLIALDLALACAAGLLVLRQIRSARIPAAEQGLRVTRREATILCVLLILAAAGATYYWYQAESAGQSALTSESVVTRLANVDGRKEAEKDFAAGAPRWYRFRYSGRLPEDRSDRKSVTVDGLGSGPFSWYNSVFFKSYNSRMDDLYYEKKHGPAKKGAKK